MVTLLLALLALVPAVSTATPAAGDAFGTCGGFAPLVTECSLDVNAYGFHLYMGFLTPTCASSLVSLPPLPRGLDQAPCYVGTLQLTADGATGDHYESACDFIVTPSGFLTLCEESGFVRVDQAIHLRCTSSVYRIRELDGPGDPIPGGLGEWGCWIQA